MNNPLLIIEKLSGKHLSACNTILLWYRNEKEIKIAFPTSIFDLNEIFLWTYFYTKYHKYYGNHDVWWLCIISLLVECRKIGSTRFIIGGFICLSTVTLQRARQLVLALNVTWRLKQWSLRNRAAARSKLSGYRRTLSQLHHREFRIGCGQSNTTDQR